jgi:cell division protein FtsB
MQNQNTLEVLSEKVSELVQNYTTLKSENEALRMQIVTLKAEQEMKNQEITKLTELNAMKDMEIEEIVSKIETILG